MSFCKLSECLLAIQHEGPMSQLTAHIHNKIQGEWEWLCWATALRGQSIKNQHTYNHASIKSMSIQYKAGNICKQIFLTQI